MFSELVISLIKLYQFLNPFLNRVVLSVFGFTFTCHQSPTCSEYTILAIRQHGTMRGFYKGLQRVWYCRG